eukprot:6214009-Pleurochrysis_carterae.AAC.3
MCAGLLAETPEVALLYLGIPVPCNSAGDRYGSCPDVVFCNGQKFRAEAHVSFWDACCLRRKESAAKLNKH